MQRRRLGLCLALVIELHVALLALPTRSAGHPRPASDGGARPALQVRVLAEKPSVATPHSVPVRTPAAAAVSDQPAPPLPTTPATTPPPFALALPAGDSDDDYFPRSALSIGPVPEQPVLIDYPAGAPAGAARYVTELSLFIDETGRVVRVRVDGPALPPAFEASARAAFLNARFSPGRIRDQAVRVHLRVEVGFESGDPLGPGG